MGMEMEVKWKWDGKGKAAVPAEGGAVVPGGRGGDGYPVFWER